MDDAWKTLKKIFLILLFVYIIDLLVYTDYIAIFLENQKKENYQNRRYLFEIFNLEY